MLVKEFRGRCVPRIVAVGTASELRGLYCCDRTENTKAVLWPVAGVSVEPGRMAEQEGGNGAAVKAYVDLSTHSHTDDPAILPRGCEAGANGPVS